MNKINLPYIIFILCLYIYPYSFNAQWYQQNSGTNSFLRGVSFADANTGYAVGLYGTILKTTNGGLNWNRQIISDTINHLLAVDFVDANTGTITGSVGTLHTTNGGLNWIMQSSFGGYGISFINSNTGFICGPVIIKTTNSGLTWIQQYVPPSAGYYGISIVDSNVGYACGAPTGPQATVIKTTNGGINWNLIYTFPAGNADLNGVSFSSINRGIVVSEQSVVFTTTNGGINWIGNIIIGGEWHGVSFVDSNNAFAVGGAGFIIHSTNSGINWAIQNSGTGNALYSVFFLDSLNGYAVGYYGTILHTTTGGIEFVEKLNKEITANFQLYQNYPNPFNSKTKIKYQISEPSFVQIHVYDILGKEIYTYSDNKQPGSYEIQFDGTNFASGIYFYRIEAGNFTNVKKMVLLK